MADDPINGPYVRGKLALAGMGERTDLATWLDACYAVWADIPDPDHLKKLANQLVRKSAMLRPAEFREMWGKTPEQQALTGKLGRGPGVESNRPAPGAAPDPAKLQEHWERIQSRVKKRPGR